MRTTHPASSALLLLLIFLLVSSSAVMVVLTTNDAVWDMVSKTEAQPLAVNTLKRHGTPVTHVVTEKDVCDDLSLKIAALVPMTKLTETCASDGICTGVWESPYSLVPTKSIKYSRTDNPPVLLTSPTGAVYRQELIERIQSNCGL